MQNARGNLLVSTRADSMGRKIVALILAAILIWLAYFTVTDTEFRAGLVINTGSFEMGRMLQVVLPVVLVAFAVYALVMVFKGSKSYVEVYENAVVGTTEMNAKNRNESMKNFEIGFDEIANISESKKSIQIFTPYTSYQVAALKNRAAAVQAIRARMKGQTANR